MSFSKTKHRLTPLGFLLSLSLGTFSSHAWQPDPHLQSFAFVDVNVVPMDSDRILKHQTVLVEGDRIRKIGPAIEVIIPTNSVLIKGAGKYLIPGLADMHQHMNGLQYLPLLTAAGVTTTRNMWGDVATHLAWREKIRARKMDGPTIYTTGPVMEGEHPRQEGSLRITDPEKVDALIQIQKEQGFDFLKVYDSLSMPVYQAIVAAGKKYGMPVVGHVPFAAGLQGVFAAGQQTIEHLTGYIHDLQRLDSPVREEYIYTANTNLNWIPYVDESRIPELAQQTQKAGTWNCVTLVQWEMGQVLSNDARNIMSHPAIRYLPRKDIADWDPTKDPAITQRTAESTQLKMRMFELKLKLTKALHDAGAGLLAGTDVGNTRVIAGFGLHQELKNFVKAGLTPYEALQTATYNPAKYLDATSEFGQVKEGLRADLVLLDANPLDSIIAVEKNSGVMVRGKWFSPAMIQKSLDALVVRP